MNIASEKRLSAVYPELARRIRALDVNLGKLGIQIVVVQGLRTFAEQDALFAQGRTRPGQIVTRAKGGQSLHNYGLAVDVAPVILEGGGKIDWNDLHKFFVIGQEGKKLRLEWGGDWKKFLDKPHLQMPSPSINVLFGLYQKGKLPAVWAEVERRATK